MTEVTPQENPTPGLSPSLRNGLAAMAVLSGLLSLALQGGPAGGSLIAGLLAALFACAACTAANPRWGILATSALAFGANAYLFGRKLEGAAGPSACNVSEVLNCDAVNTSAASELFGLPVTLYGMGLYAGLVLVTMYNPQRTPRLFQVTGLFAIPALAFSAYLAWESKKLGAFCAVCATIYVANAILMGAAWLGLRGQRRTLSEDLGGALGSTSLLTIVASFLVVVVVGAGRWQQVNAPLGSAETGRGAGDPAALQALYNTPVGAVQLDGTEPVLGNPSAPYMIVEWADFGCPHCARAAEELHQLVRAYPVQVRFKVFPLTAACNPALEHDGGPERCRAALAAECAHRQGRFEDFTRVLFKNQAYMSDADLSFMANQVGLDVTAWSACMAEPSVLDGVVADAMAGAKAGVRGTPAMFLMGTHGDQYVEVPLGPAAVARLIEAHEAGSPLPPPGPPPEM